MGPPRVNHPLSKLRVISNPRAGSPTLQPASLWSHGDLAVGMPAGQPNRSQLPGIKPTAKKAGTRDATGVLHANEKFPDMKALADYVHRKGLKLGIYSSPGPQTCAKFEGSYGHEQQDADLCAAWGIDFLKYDLCTFRTVMAEAAPNDKREQLRLMREAYEKMHQALLKAGRPIVYSLCEYGYDSVWQWAPEVGAHLWRTSDDMRGHHIRTTTV